MPSIEAQHDYPLTPQPLWDLIADFGNIEAWWPKGAPIAVERVELEGEGVGMTRHIYNQGIPAPVSERLDALDKDNWSWRLSIVGQRPAGLTAYQAAGRIEPLPDGGCRISYHGEFEAEPGREEEARQFLLAAYQLMFIGLKQTTQAA